MQTVESFRTRYPEFTQGSFDDLIVQTHLNECALMLSEEKYGKKFEQCLFLLTAHELKLKSLGVDSQKSVSARSIEGGSISYINLATNDYQLYYSKTAYGQKFLTLKRTIRFVGTVCD